MEYGKIENNIVLSKIKQHELLGLIKSQIPCTLVFTSEGSVMQEITLNERVVVGGIQMINIELLSGPEQTISYTKLLETIGEGLKFGILTAEIDKSIFKEKEPLIAILDNIRQEIVESCVFIDYSDGVFSIINKDINKISDKLYFFEDNNSVLVFSKDGPKIIINQQITSVEDVFCVK